MKAVPMTTEISRPLIWESRPLLKKLLLIIMPPFFAAPTKSSQNRFIIYYDYDGNIKSEPCLVKSDNLERTLSLGGSCSYCSEKNDPPNHTKKNHTKHTKRVARNFKSLWLAFNSYRKPLG